MSESIERVGVVGAGLMGAGIAEVAAKAGVDVTVCDINDAAVSAGRSRIETSLQRAVKAGKLDDDAAMAALARVRFVTDIGELADRQLVVEAVREFEDEKLEVFQSLGKIVSVSESSAGVPMPVYDKSTAMGGGAGIAPGQQTIQTALVVVYEASAK